MTTPRRQIGDVLLKVDGIHLSFGGIRALDGVSFEIGGERSWPSSVLTEPAKAPC